MRLVVQKVDGTIPLDTYWILSLLFSKVGERHKIQWP